jgi:hypothetical protein
MSAVLEMVSQCCEAPVRAEGRVTWHYRCTECGKACDVKRPPDRRPCEVCGQPVSCEPGYPVDIKVVHMECIGREPSGS